MRGWRNVQGFYEDLLGPPPLAGVEPLGPGRTERLCAGDPELLEELLEERLFDLLQKECTCRP